MPQTGELLPFDFNSLLQDGDALIIVPPFASLERPSLSVHVLQGCAGQVGVHVSVLYASVIFAASIGENNYISIVRNDYPGLLTGELLFADAAYNVPLLACRTHWLNYVDRLRDMGEITRWPDLCRLDLEERGVDTSTEAAIQQDFKASGIGWLKLQWLSTKASEWADAVAAAVVQRGFKIVGCTTMFDQTAASVALLNRIKRMCPETVTVIGGSNCEGEMAQGISSLSTEIDFVFSGESEVSFPRFVKQALSGKLPPKRIVYGNPYTNLDEIPKPRYVEFFEQRERFLPDSVTSNDDILIPYESSRGCWWGQKHQCTFCGLNGLRMEFRAKSPDKVADELKRLVDECPSRKVIMTDSIMPYNYFRNLVPRLASEIPKVDIIYEQKANLSLENVLALKGAGITRIQPGIEALSSSLLKRMRKGVSASQNIALLRYARSAKLLLDWNLLYGFPGDQLCEYEQTLALLPLLRHLYPPKSFHPIKITRFSPYFTQAKDYGVQDVRPLETHVLVFPPDAQVTKLVSYFSADYQSDSRENQEIMLKIAHEVASWYQAWSSSESSPPVLHLHRLSNKTFLLCDSRGLPGTWRIQFLDRELAAAVSVSGRFGKTAEIEWAVNQKVGIELDGRYVPLLTAEPALLREFETGLCEVDQVAAQPSTDLHTSCGRKGVNKVMPGNKPTVNPLVVFREEFDDWAILFDPDSGNSFGLDPVSAFIWKRLDGRHTIQDIVAELQEICEGVPKDAEERINDFIQDLVEQGLAGFKLQKV